MHKAANPTETFLELPFKVDSISRATAPAGAEGVWHSYVISQGTNTITGVRVGTHAEVSTLLQDMIERLNERRAGKKRQR
jgi:Na+-translocating ferredoxin:NAD+ oxidoreductase RnfG subunit